MGPTVLGALLLLACTLLPSGCATLPEVDLARESSTAGAPTEIVGAEGEVSQAESRALLSRIRKRVESTDILERYAALMELIGVPPLSKDNRATLLIDGPRTYDAMFRAIESARDHIHFETFIVRDDESGTRLSDQLLRKRAEGVAVRFLYDGIGGVTTPESFFRRLRDGGVQVLEFNPVGSSRPGNAWGVTHRDHRKILVVDGKVGITGGINISEEYSSGIPGRGKKGKGVYWRDTDVQIEGPAVAELQKLFLDTWKRQEGPPLTPRNHFPSHIEVPGRNDLVQIVGSKPGDENRLVYIMYIAAFEYARNSIHLTNAYFLPDRKTIDTLAAAAKRGVDVKIIVPGSTDIPISLHASRYNYAELLKAGVKLYEHTSDVLHAKTAVIDGVWSTVGSANMDMWSSSRNDEVNAVILSRDFARQMEEMFERDLTDSKKIDPAQWKRDPQRNRFLELIGRLISHWL